MARRVSIGGPLHALGGRQHEMEISQSNCTTMAIRCCLFRTMSIPFMEAIKKCALMPACCPSTVTLSYTGRKQWMEGKFGKGYVVLKRWEFQVHSGGREWGGNVHVSDVLSDSHGHFMHWWRQNEGTFHKATMAISCSGWRQCRFVVESGVAVLLFFRTMLIPFCVGRQ